MFPPRNLVYSHLLDARFTPGGVAQGLEQAAHNRLVAGSNPATPTTYIDKLILRSFYKGMTAGGSLPSSNPSLLERAPIQFAPEQLDLFTVPALRIQALGNFTAAKAVEQLETQNSNSFIGIDIGGDKIGAQLYEVRDGLVIRDPAFNLQHSSNDGEGYMEVSEETARFAAQHKVPVGVSYAGPVDGTKPIDGPNVKRFLSLLEDRYDNDFGRLLPSLAALGNDAVSGLTESAVNLERTNPGIKNVIYLINGSGLGGAALVDGTLYAAEPGHIEAIARFNRWKRQEACGMGGATFTCIEKVAASKAGIEPTYAQITGEQLDGRAIEDRYRGGDQLAAALYENSTQIAAHAIAGLARALQISLNPDVTAVVGHGGAFKFPNYAERIQQHLTANDVYEPLVTTTYRFSDNACLDGAATLAALAA